MSTRSVPLVVLFLLFAFALPSLFFLSPYGLHRALHSFPTRRSSDLGVRRAAADGPVDELLRPGQLRARIRPRDRKITRLNSSHVAISYAVFCLKKKKFHAKLTVTKRVKVGSEAMTVTTTIWLQPR